MCYSGRLVSSALSFVYALQVNLTVVHLRLGLREELGLAQHHFKATRDDKRTSGLFLWVDGNSILKRSDPKDRTFLFHGTVSQVMKRVRPCRVRPCRVRPFYFTGMFHGRRKTYSLVQSTRENYL